MYTEKKAITLIIEHFQLNYQKIKDIKEIEEYIIHKLKHSFAVLRAGYRILEADEKLKQLDEKTKQKFLFVALMHDVGRFYQHDGKKISPNNLIDHGFMGYKILKNQAFTDSGVLLSIKYHNKSEEAFKKIFLEEEYINLNKEQKKEAEMLARFIRDADKLENLEYMSISSFYREKNNLTSEGVKSNILDISDDILDEFLSGTDITYKNRKTQGDIITSFIGWINDINYKATKELLKKSSLFEEYLKYLNDIGYTRRIDEIKKYLEDY